MISGIDALRKAKTILGSETATAVAVGVTQPSVNYILRKGKRVPAEWCIPLEEATREAGEEISRHQLRPDLWPTPLKASRKRESSARAA